jgi:ubiquinone/menaquinone biosynthesis C-methylase UbiE
MAHDGADVTIPMSTIRADFDRLALFSEEGWNHNQHYHSVLLRQVPVPCHQALEVGCGTGAFARLLAERAERVLAVGGSALAQARPVEGAARDS